MGTDSVTEGTNTLTHPQGVDALHELLGAREATKTLMADVDSADLIEVRVRVRVRVMVRVRVQG